MSRVIEGVNDLLTVNEQLASEWHPVRNGDLCPSQVSAGTTRKAWWRCSQGHEWEASISSRNRGAGCPYCAGQRAIQGVNDLVTINPGLAAEWHPIKNCELTPSAAMPKSSKKVWWLGGCGHEWEATISSRSNGGGCPYCSGKKVLRGFNDLATVNPNLASEWHYEKNGNLLPEQVTAHSGRKVWWLGKCGHEWQAAVACREDGHGCPYCSGRLALAGFNDLVTSNPYLAAEWHPTKNGALLPTQVTAGSSKKVWWLGGCGHEWEATISSRSNGGGCPYCSGKKVLRGFNDLATVNPNLASEWHYEKNGNLLPEQVTAHSGRKVWWLGKCGHEWETSINNRANGANCPFCSHPHERRSNEQFKKQLAVSRSTVTPLEPYVGSRAKILMRCDICGHTWKASPSSILNNPERCPNCWEMRRGISAIKSNAEFLSDLAKVNPYVLPLELYKKSKEPLRCRCELCGCEWMTTPSALLRGNGCPACNHSQTSFVEQCIYHAFCLRLGASSVLSRDKIAIGMELDIYIPSKSLAIEYGAWYWHKDRIERDKEKAKACADRGIRMIEIYDAFPEGEIKPSDMECLTFRSPLSLTQNRLQLQGLLNLLLEHAGLTALSVDDITKVISEAHRHSRRKTTDDFIDDLAEVTDKIEVLGEYRAKDCKIEVQCKSCGHKWSATPGNLLAGCGCPRCKALEHSARSRKDHGQFLRELSVANPSVEVVGEYVSNKRKMAVRCKVCGFKWLGSPSHLLAGHGCPRCAGRHQGTVVCVETGLEYENYSQAAKAVGLIGSSGVKDACLNPNRTAGGLHWRFKDESEECPPAS